MVSDGLHTYLHVKDILKIQLLFQVSIYINATQDGSIGVTVFNLFVIDKPAILTVSFGKSY